MGCAVTKPAQAGPDAQAIPKHDAQRFLNEKTSAHQWRPQPAHAGPDAQAIPKHDAQRFLIPKTSAHQWRPKPAHAGPDAQALPKHDAQRFLKEKTSAHQWRPKPAHAGPDAQPKRGRGFHTLGGLGPRERPYIILRHVLETSARTRSLARLLLSQRADSWRSLQGGVGGKMKSTHDRRPNSQAETKKSNKTNKQTKTNTNRT